MSSAVTYSYRVREEELRRQRELQAARDALRAAAERHERLRERSADLRRAWGDAIPVPDRVVAPAAGGAEALRAEAQRIERAADAAQRRVEEAVVDARIAVLTEGIAIAKEGEVAPVTAADAIERSRLGRSEERAAAAKKVVDESLDRILAKLDPTAADEIVEKIRAGVELVRESDSASGRAQALDALRLSVQRANQAVREERSREHLIDECEVRLNGFDGPEADRARELIAAARGSRRQATTSLEALVEDAIARESESQEAEYVAAELRGTLERLGYEVGPEFETALLNEGYTQFTRTNWPGYAVRVRTGGRPPSLNFNVVRGYATRVDQGARDREVEQEFCQRQAEMVAALARSGIAAERTRVVEPGERELLVVEDLGGSGRRAAHEKARESGR